MLDRRDVLATEDEEDLEDREGLDCADGILKEVSFFKMVGNQLPCLITDVPVTFFASCFWDCVFFANPFGGLSLIGLLRWLPLINSSLLVSIFLSLLLPLFVRFELYDRNMLNSGCFFLGIPL